MTGKLSLYKRRVNDGLCGKCGQPLGDSKSKSLCSTHLEESRHKTAARRKLKKAAGLCATSGCKSPPEKGKSRCRQHLDEQHVAVKAERARRKEVGLCQCTGCKNPPIPGRTICQKHSDEMTAVSAERYHLRREAGTCGYCDQPVVPGYVVCQYHLQQQRDHKAETKLAALNAYGGPRCSQCGNASIDILEIDHIDGGGNQHRKQVTQGAGGYPFHHWLKANGYPEGFQVLCPTCNKAAHLRRLRAN